MMISVKARTPILALILFVFTFGQVLAADPPRVVVIPLGGDDIKGLTFTGPQVNLPQRAAEAAGFSICHTQAYGDSEATAVNTILTKCNKPELMLACRPVGNPKFTVAAHAPRQDVTSPTPDNATTTLEVWGAGWYFTTEAWGFAPVGAPVNKDPCDDEDYLGEERLCWHKLPEVRAGWRCGRTQNIFDSSWERVVLQR